MTYYNPVQIYEGRGSFQQLPDIISGKLKNNEKHTTLLLIWNEHVLNNATIQILMKEGNCKAHVTTVSNPDIKDLFSLHRELEDDYQLVVAIGGGSVLDLGKSLCCLHGNSFESEDDLREFIKEKKYENPEIEWIGVPTTAGTGSEVTPWATVWDFDNHAKLSIDTPHNFASAAIIDAQFLESMPLSLAVSSALDAIGHATESYWAKASNEISKGLALQSIRKIMRNIPDLWCEEKKCNALDQIAQGSLLAGLAFSNTRTTACHSMSYPLTMRYGLPHGVAVSLLLAPIFEANVELIQNVDELFLAYGAKSTEEIQGKINGFLEKVGYNTNLESWGVKKDEFEWLVISSMTKGRADNNPVNLTKNLILDILNQIH